MAKGTFSFEDLDKAMTKVDGLGSIITENEFSKIGEWIPTGNYLLNAQLSGSLFKGLPGNRGVVFAGESGCLTEDSEIEVYVSDSKVERVIIKE